MPDINLKVSYHNGDAEQGRLDLYDASISMQGLAQALTITTHAILNDGAVRRRGDRVEGARIFINPSRKGSFVEILTVAVSDPVAQAFGVSVLSAAFWDVFKWTWAKTLDRDVDPTTPFGKRLAERKEPFIGEIAESLEVPLERVHRPIRQFEDMTIVVQRPKVGEVLRLDRDSMLNVSLTTEPMVTAGILGNVTRYNILSGYGRFFSEEVNHTVSFRLSDNVPYNERELVTWSIDQAQRGQPGRLLIDAQRTVSARGVVKRYLVHQVRRA